MSSDGLAVSVPEIMISHAYDKWLLSFIKMDLNYSRPITGNIYTQLNQMRYTYLLETISTVIPM